MIAATALALVCAQTPVPPAPAPPRSGLSGIGYGRSTAAEETAAPAPVGDDDDDRPKDAIGADGMPQTAPVDATGAALGTDGAAPTLAPAASEKDAYVIEYFKMPDGCVLEVGGMAFMPDGRLVVSTRRGQVWMIENALAKNVGDAKVTLFHEGLWEGLGLDVVDGAVYVLQRGEISRLDDLDGDGRCDRVSTFADDWGVSGHYHEYAFGLPRDSQGNLFMGLNVSFGDPEWWHGRSTVPYRGWIMRVTPDGSVEPWAHGVRSPNGVAVDSKDRVFVTDNQGDWVASSPIYLIEKGGFYGHPKSLNWTEDYRAAGKVADDEIPPAEASTGRRPVAIWIPYQWSRSTGNLLEDTTGGKFGVPKGQFIVAELTNGMILRAGFEDVQGVTQGWVTPLVQKIGSVNRVLQAPDGTVFCGMTNRGWGGRPPADGLARVRFTGHAPMEISTMRIVDVPMVAATVDGSSPAGQQADAYGFELAFSEPVHADWTPGEQNVSVLQYDYNYWWEYGSPEQHSETLDLSSATLSADRTKLVVRCADLLPAMCVRVTLKGVSGAAGNPLVHPEISYTINQLPSGQKTNAYVAKLVPPPPSRGDVGAGVLHLSWGDAMAQFENDGWELVDARLDEDNPGQFVISEGKGAIVNTGKTDASFKTKGVFGDSYSHLEFMLTKGSAMSVIIGDVEVIALTDDPGRCGSTSAGLPTKQVSIIPGEWVRLESWTRLASPDAPAHVDRIQIDGVTVHEAYATEFTETRRGPLSIEGVKGQVGLRNIQVKPMDRQGDGGGAWEFIDPSESWDDWDVSGDASFELTGEGIEASGALGHLWLPVDDFENGIVRFRAKSNSNGAGALILRANEGDDGSVAGYAVRLNSSFPDSVLTGSLSGGGVAAPVPTELIATDSWVDVEVAVSTANGKTTLAVSLNGVLINEMTDDSPLPVGGIALRCDHEGTVLGVVNVRMQR